MSKLRKSIDVEALIVWALRDQCADRAAGMHVLERMADGHEVRGMSATARAAEIGLLGHRVDGGGTCSVRRVPHDADQVVAALSCLPAGVRGLVFRHGKVGTRPALPGDAQCSLAPVIDKRGRLGVMREGRRGLEAGYVSPERMFLDGRVVWCRVARRGPHPDAIAAARDVWAAWVEGLVQVRAALLSDYPLDAHEVTGPDVQVIHRGGEKNRSVPSTDIDFVKII